MLLQPKLEMRRGVVLKDLAHGLEAVRIPVINDIDNTKLPQLAYQRYTCIACILDHVLTSRRASANRLRRDTKRHCLALTDKCLCNGRSTPLSDLSWTLRCTCCSARIYPLHDVGSIYACTSLPLVTNVIMQMLLLHPELASCAVWTCVSRFKRSCWYFYLYLQYQTLSQLR